MTRTFILTALGAAALVIVGGAGVVHAQHGGQPHGAPAHGAPSHPAPNAGETRSMADDASAWRKSPHMMRFYELTKTSFARGPARVDFPTYQEKSYVIFREFAAANGVKPEAMVDHLKAIPGQMLQIVADDPKALDTYDSFWEAMVGPA